MTRDMLNHWLDTTTVLFMEDSTTSQIFLTRSAIAITFSNKHQFSANKSFLLHLHYVFSMHERSFEAQRQLKLLYVTSKFQQNSALSRVFMCCFKVSWELWNLSAQRNLFKQITNLQKLKSKNNSVIVNLDWETLIKEL